ncbi:MAG: DEAD/DEAH box helicase, partial [Gammaproteobacteria bacterium]|nr:DEAD/DEAH box helicase [Gammaproteobacteria bacterium]
MEPEVERAAAELKWINAEAHKLAAEADKLEAEEQRLNSRSPGHTRIRPTRGRAGGRRRPAGDGNYGLAITRCCRDGYLQPIALGWTRAFDPHPHGRVGDVPEVHAGFIYAGRPSPCGSLHIRCRPTSPGFATLSTTNTALANRMRRAVEPRVLTATIRSGPSNLGCGSANDTWPFDQGPVKLEFPDELPITPRMGDIVKLMREHRVLIVAGETGSGKTTQLPKACLAAGWGRRGMIAHTQPRRLAARTVAARIAAEMCVEVGAEVGYAVRFSERTSPATVVKVMTDGLLLNDIQRDRRLKRYECVIVDEAHERSLNVDFLLGYLRRLLDRRADLKVVVTSATIDVEAFAKHFGGAPVVEVSGRGYPVETIYRPADDPERGVVDVLREIGSAPQATSAQDVLVFQSGEREIFETTQLLRREFEDRF